MPAPDLARHWTLDPDVAFLNHGSFGACPRPVLARQAELRAQLERQPVEFFVRRYEGLIDEARADLAAFLGADPEALVPVPNATTGVNAVLRSLDLDPGDELVTTDHEYNACRNALDFVAERHGATVRVAEIPFPLQEPGQVIERVLAEVGPRTRLALIDHVTSQTGLVLPLPDGSAEPPESPLYADPLQEELLGEHGIEVPIIPWPAPPKRLIRISAQIYNHEDQYRKLAEVLPGLV